MTSSASSSCLRHMVVLIPTLGRTTSLLETLQAIARARRPDRSFEVVVLDNALDTATREVVTDGHWPFAHRYVPCPERGKNRALNRGMAETNSELVVFLDDDVSPEEDYFLEVVAGADRWPRAVAFGGSVLSQWPGNVGDVHERVISYVEGYAFGSVNYDFGEGEFEADGPRGGAPVGANLILRRSCISGDSPFDPETGPACGTYRMGGAEPLLRQLRSRGEQIVYLPRALVWHRIRPEQLSYDWISSRSISFGRSVNHFDGQFRGVSGSSPSWLLGGQWIARLAREAIMMGRGKEYPAMWARMERKIIEGVLYDRWRTGAGGLAKRRLSE